MKTNKQTWNNTITDFVEKIGGKKGHSVGIYTYKGLEIDLTSSGSEEWQITKNILEQLVN